MSVPRETDRRVSDRRSQDRRATQREAGADRRSGVDRRVVAIIQTLVGFQELSSAMLRPELQVQVERLPKPASECRIRCGGFSSMYEPGFVCGYFESQGVLMALVIYEDLFDGDLNSYAIVSATMVRHKPTKVRPPKDVLRYNRKGW